VARGDGAGELIPVVAGPAVVPRGRAAHDGSIGGAARDHDVGTCVQGLHDAPATEVGVGGDVVRFGNRLTCLEVDDLDSGLTELVEPREDVVAVDVRDLG